jgi:3-oxoacyl-[acyl-carrier protein] reductase
MTLDFTNKKVLITGGTRGIGKEIVLQYAKLNAHVVLTGTAPKAPNWITKNMSYEALNITIKSDWKSQVKDIIDKYEGFNILINNAGINKVSKIYELENSDLENILLTNLNAPIYITSEVSKTMLRKKTGYIINIASIFGVVSKSGRNPYTASKSGLIGVTKTMAIDLGEHNILVNAVSPGFVDTELTRKVLGEKGMKEMERKIPLNKLAQTSDIVPMILFLTSECNTYITGQNIVIDGGFTCE